MKLHELVKPWMIAGLLAIFVSACATTQEEMIKDDGPPVEDQSQSGTAIADDGSSGGADATGLDDGDTGDGSAIVDESTMTALERLEQTDGTLSSRVVYFEYNSAKLTSESIETLEIHGNFIAGNGEQGAKDAGRWRLEGKDYVVQDGDVVHFRFNV